jgi:peptidoglycan hydrolase-like protein with peptidoglycan-binding domain
LKKIASLLVIGSIVSSLIASQSAFAATSVLKTGMKGKEVAELQVSLGIPADGVYGSQTASAVKKFQIKYKLTADGIAGQETQAVLQKLSSIQKPTTSPAPVSRPNQTMSLQKSLYVLGFLSKSSDVDGIYGNVTKTAVMNLQKKTGLVVDGIVGPKTLAVIEKLLTSKK